MDNTEDQQFLAYHKFISELSKGFDLSPLKQEFEHFWRRWTFLHTSLCNQINIKNPNKILSEEELTLLTKKFLKKREGMVSAFIQGIKHHPKFKSEISLLQNILWEHDLNFKNLLSHFLKLMHTELVRVQSHRKVSNAYINSQSSLRG
ncbi:hypothetical protein [Spirobacillus cienkowskii]|uniref:Uncharacterized protein n=1 Tax=Spirobacillus cienkowskii TaxID=495820 RepID=A0A369KQW9_9BACT|nr:MAG: hypothetical protein DCC88_07505 [Spirobacillus cienkowskii]